MEIRKSKREDLKGIMSIYAYARNFMAENGNAGQWGKNYPSQTVVEKDIQEQRSYVCIEDSKIVGVFYFAEKEDPTYKVIEDGDWINDKPYGVIHRIASAEGTKGVATFCMNWVYEQIGNIRIDTHRNNIPMQSLLIKLGFKRCGVIYLADGSPRIAFQRCIKSECAKGDNK
ncbi:MAG: GNAT family protein [Anaerostipes sp.]|nr:GNAT family protein [Anaerostipes sp.]